LAVSHEEQDEQSFFGQQLAQEERAIAAPASRIVR
jgi:hypothetical protein